MPQSQRSPYIGDHGRARYDSGLPTASTRLQLQFSLRSGHPLRIGTIGLESLIEISLGIASADFKRMAESYLGRWDLVQLRCANFMSCTLEERLALILLELSENFGVPDGEGVRLTLPARHRDLAELVGASRPRITEHMIWFEKKHFISRDKRKLVVYRDRLQLFLAQTHISADSTRTMVKNKTRQIRKEELPVGRPSRIVRRA